MARVETGIKTRSANPDLSDFGSLYAIITDHWQDYDDEEPDPRNLVGLLKEGSVLVFDYYGTPIGGMSFTDIVEGVRATIHLVIRPKYLKRVLKARAVEEALDKAFLALDVLKIKAVITKEMAQQQKWLKRYGFKRAAYLTNETIVKGTPTDVLIYELNREYWHKTRLEGMR